MEEHQELKPGEKTRDVFDEALATLKELQVQQRRFEKKIERIFEDLYATIVYVFGELSKSAGMGFEEFVRKSLTYRMRGSGEIPKDKELISTVIEGEEVDLFLEEPLIVGEVTTHAESADEEVGKLMRKVEKVREVYGREPRKLLIVETARKSVAKRLRKLAEKNGVELIVGRAY